MSSAMARKKKPEPQPAPPKSAAGRQAGEPEAPKFRATAEDLARGQREISVSEFFAKNRHLLGFDNPTRALLTAVKEAVDNSLDACEEAGVLPDIRVEIQARAEDRFHILVEDNGPGIVRAQIPKIFGKLLYGSKFHAMKQARGQQGIGISAAGLYAQITTGKGVTITTRTGPNKKPHLFELFLDTAKNEPVIVRDEEGKWDRPHGTRIEMELEARYVKGEKSVDEYLAETALANPHVELTYLAPTGNGNGKEKPEPVVYKRSSKLLPEQPRSIKPHPYGVELGVLIKMLQSSRSRNVKGCLQSDFSRVSPRIARQICEKAGLSEKARPRRIARQEAEKLYRAIQKTKIMAPPTDCLSPIGEEQILNALKANVTAEFFSACTRSPNVYRGNPFQIEVGLAYGIEGYPADQTAILNRYANRVPLLYQPGACVISKATLTTDWKNYGISQSRGALPTGPMLIMVHMASVWVPFTSEAKEAVAHYPEIIKEVRLGLQECGRRLSQHMSRKRKAEYEVRRRSIFELYIEELSRSLNGLTKCGRDRIKNDLLKLAKKITKKGEM